MSCESSLFVATEGINHSMCLSGAERMTLVVSYRCPYQCHFPDEMDVVFRVRLENSVAQIVAQS
jgi:hypothetical protein